MLGQDTSCGATRLDARCAPSFSRTCIRLHLVTECRSVSHTPACAVSARPRKPIRSRAFCRVLSVGGSLEESCAKRTHASSTVFRIIPHAFSFVNGFFDFSEKMAVMLHKNSVAKLDNSQINGGRCRVWKIYSCSFM